MGNSWKSPKRYKIYTLAKKVRDNDDVADIIKKYAQSGKIKRVVDIRVPLNLNNYQSPINSLETTKEFIESLGLEYESNTPFEIHPTYSLNAYNGLLKMMYGSGSLLTKDYPGKSWNRTLILGEYVNVDFSDVLANHIKRKFMKSNSYKIKFDIVKLESAEPIKLHTLSFKGRTDIEVYSLINKNGIDCVIDTRTIEAIQEQENMEESLDDYIKILNETTEYKYYHLKNYAWGHPKLERYKVNKDAIFTFIRRENGVFWNNKVAIIGESDDENDYAYMYAEIFARIVRLLYLDVRVEKL